MARTRDQIMADLRSQEPQRFAYEPDSDAYPDNRRPFTTEEYEASLSESADSILAQEQQADIDAERLAFRALVRGYLLTLADNEATLVAGIAVLKGPSPPSTASALRAYVTSLGEMVLDHNRGLDRLIRVLIERGVIEDA